MTEEQVADLVNSDIKDHFEKVMNVVLQLRSKLEKYNELY